MSPLVIYVLIYTIIYIMLAWLYCACIALRELIFFNNKNRSLNPILQARTLSRALYFFNRLYFYLYQFTYTYIYSGRTFLHVYYERDGDLKRRYGIPGIAVKDIRMLIIKLLSENARLLDFV